MNMRIYSSIEEMEGSVKEIIMVKNRVFEVMMTFEAFIGAIYSLVGKYIFLRI